MRKATIAMIIFLLLVQIPIHGKASGKHSDWLFEFSPYIGETNAVVDLQFVIRTPDGTPINNAVLTWVSDVGQAFLTQVDAAGLWSLKTDKVTVDSAYDHVNSGVYRRTVKLTQAGHVRILVYTRQAEMVINTSTWIGGDEAYVLEVGGKPLQALVPQQHLDFMVRDKAGNSVTNIDVLRVEGNGISLSLTDAKLADLNGDGKVDGYRMTVPPIRTGNIQVFAATGKGNIYGKLSVPVAPPPVEVSPVGSLTAAWAETVTLESTLADARGKRIPFTYRIRGVQASFAVQSHVEPAYLQVYQAPQSADRHELSIVTSVAVGASDPKLIIEVSFNGQDWAEVSKLIIKPAVIECDKTFLVVDTANWLKAKVLNARGEPCAMATVQLLDSWGMTDSHGEVVLLVTPHTTGSFPLRVSSGQGSYLEKKIEVKVEEVSQRYVLQLGVANPNMGLLQPPVLVGGRVMLPFRWFGENILGANVDYFMENGCEVITLTRGMTDVKLLLGESMAYVNGRGTLLDAAPRIVGGRTLVPARFLAETFGYNVTWVAATSQVIIEER